MLLFYPEAETTLQQTHGQMFTAWDILLITVSQLIRTDNDIYLIRLLLRCLCLVICDSLRNMIILLLPSDKQNISIVHDDNDNNLKQ